MVVASFLTKNLLLHWQHGMDWFWEYLYDADLANNSASWQWVAGTGADAAPYYRIFNPILQSQKFDPDGEYILKYVPELAGVPKEMIHTPWQVKARNYPDPIVDADETRKEALKIYLNLPK
jgi:deoxyribodipyrimidine photo-lyase